VSQSSLLPNSIRIRATPKVTMSRVRSEPRNTLRLQTAPKTAVTATATANHRAQSTYHRLGTQRGNSIACSRRACRE
jgi:hypothetical protein